MQRIACFTAVVLFSTICLAGCSSGWTLANLRDNLTFRKPSPPANHSVSELKSRAQQLERLQQFEIAAEVYAEILKQDHDNQYAQQRLTAIQQMKNGLPEEPSHRSPIRESLPVSRQSEPRLPKVTPGEPEKSHSIAIRDQGLNSANSVPPTRTNVPGSASMNAPVWAAAGAERSQPIAAEQYERKRVPLDQFVARSTDKYPVQTVARNENRNSPSVNLPAIYDKQTLQRLRNSSTQLTGVSQVSMTTVLPEIRHPDSESTASQEYSLIDVQKRLSTHPADPSAIESLVQGLRTEDRIEQWEISSTLGVLIQNPDSKSLIIDSLSRALVDKEDAMRRQTALAIASLGRNALEMLPALEARLSDKDQAVRTAAAFAIDQIR